MTARSGDAMSHVNFRARQNIILIDLGAPILSRRRGDGLRCRRWVYAPPS